MLYPQPLPWEGDLVIVHLRGEFDSCAQPALREAFHWITGPVTLDVADAWLGAAALGEIVCLAKRIGLPNVTLLNPPPVMRRLLAVSQLDRIIRITNGDAATHTHEVHSRTSFPRGRTSRVISPKANDPCSTLVAQSNRGTVIHTN
jgi:anti-anti-sigma regulatory factor